MGQGKAWRDHFLEKAFCDLQVSKHQPRLKEAQQPLSVLLCTHNPHASHLKRTLDALTQQRPTPEFAPREIIIVDNASEPPLQRRRDIAVPDGARVVVEPRLGLTHARRKGFSESEGDILVYVDDDNILDENYLSGAISLMRDNPHFGAIGGKVLPQYEATPPPWFARTGIGLACRDLGDEPLEARWQSGSLQNRTYPECAPIGAGIVLRRSAYAAYIEETTTAPMRLALGRRGVDLASGEDNDMVMTALKHGWTVAYRPELVLQHLIPAGRFSPDYLRRYAYSSNRTWVQVLNVHGISPWSAISGPTAPMRKARAFFRTQAWRGPVEQIAWAGACGMIDGRALLDRANRTETK